MKKFGVLMLSLVLLLAFAMPVMAGAEENVEVPAPDTTVIVAFAGLGEGAQVAADTGTLAEALSLPTSLAATAEDGEADALVVEGLTWECTAEGGYQAGVPGTYPFTAVLPAGFTLQEGAALPVIIVALTAPAPVEPPQSAPAAPANAALALAAGYNDHDVQVVNGIIANNGLSGYSQNDPANWDFAGWTGDAEKRLFVLDLEYFSLTGSLDVSGCTALAGLYVGYNQLTGLAVGGCTALEELWCEYNQLTSLDVSGHAALESLDFNGNPITSLNASGCTSFTDFAVSWTQLESLDLSNCTGLVEVDVYYNALTSLNVSGCSAWKF